MLLPHQLMMVSSGRPPRCRPRPDFADDAGAYVTVQQLPAEGPECRLCHAATW